MGEAVAVSESNRGCVFKRIRKRDGRLVSFDPVKITDAIFKAALAVGGSNREIAENLTDQVLCKLKEIAGDDEDYIPAVEEVQDVVEKVLIENGHARTAKAYIVSRLRTRVREAKSELMDVVKEILMETSRENANISNSPAARYCRLAWRRARSIT